MASGSPWRAVFNGAGVVVGDYRCNCHRVSPGPEETSRDHSFAIIRSGMFLKHAGRERIIGDANSVMFFNAGEPYRVSHPAGCDDRCTTFAVDARTAAEAAAAAGLARHADDLAPDRPFAPTSAPCDGRVFLLHRQLLSRLKFGTPDDLEPESLVFAMLEAVMAGAAAARGVAPRGVRREGAADADRERVESVCACLTARLSERLILSEIAAVAHCSPFHLCRVFRRRTGVSIHRYLTRLRVRAAAEMLAEGERDITRVALRCGFCDHSHLVRACRAELGVAPSGLRRPSSAAELRRLSTILQAAG